MQKALSTHIKYVRNIQYIENHYIKILTIVLSIFTFMFFLILRNCRFYILKI